MAHGGRNFFYFISNTTLLLKLPQRKLFGLQVHILTMGFYQKLELHYGIYGICMVTCI